MSEEKKQEGQEQQPPAGGSEQNPSAPNPGPSAEELRKQNEELQSQLKERDSKIADLETTRATIEARQKQIDADKLKQNADATLQKRISQINERRAYDPEGADADLASLLSEVKSQAAQDAVMQAQQVISNQTTIEKLRAGVKSANPEFDDDVVDVIMERANTFAETGKYRSADEAIKAATDFVKSKFEGYAKKRNAIPPLPDGARAEGGGANVPPKPPEPEKVLSPLEELEAANTAKEKRSYL